MQKMGLETTQKLKKPRKERSPRLIAYGFKHLLSMYDYKVKIWRVRLGGPPYFFAYHYAYK